MSRHFSRLRQLRTPAPTEDLRVTMAVTIHHLLADGSYLCKWHLKSSVKPTMGSYLNTVKRGGAIIAPDTIQHPLNVAQLVSAPPAVHVGDGLPDIPPGAELLPGLEAHRPVIPAHAVQQVTHGRHAARGPPGGHRGHRHPLAHPRVKPLNTGLVIIRVKSAEGVDAVIQDRDATVSSPCVHRRTRGPGVAQGVVLLHGGQAGLAVIAAAAINETIQGHCAQTGSFGSHWSNLRPLN